ncbi:MAG TPA: tetratricopeptide repeat protein, partial [Ginsengibacter sp.]|nr:tetratricopeptide repeat protein [Ginsengibacter sp.]
FVSKFDYPLENKSLTGTLIISGNGLIKNISIKPVKNFSDKQITEVRAILSSTSGSWIMPPSPKLFQFKLNFSFNVYRLANGYASSFSLVTKDTLPPIKNLSRSDKDELAIHFNNGRRLFKNGKFDKAINQFLDCLKIDPAYTDAYYDLGYSYQQMGNTKLACETWKKLKDMGQKDGENLYKTNCK